MVTNYFGNKLQTLFILENLGYRKLWETERPQSRCLDKRSTVAQVARSSVSTDRLVVRHINELRLY